MPLKYKKVDEENFEDLNAKYGLKITKDDIANAGFWGVYIIYEWELYEYSVVPVPGNPEALTDKAKETEYARELVTRGLLEEKDVVNFSAKLNRKEDAIDKKEEAPKEKKEVKALVVDPKLKVEDAPKQEAKPKTEDAPKKEVTPEPKPAEKAKVEDAPKKDPTKEKQPEKVVKVELNLEVIDDKIKSLLKMVDERLTKIEEDMVRVLEKANSAVTKEDLKSVKDGIAAVQTSLDVDNIDKLREIEASQGDAITSKPGWAKKMLKQQLG